MITLGSKRLIATLLCGALTFFFIPRSWSESNSGWVGTDLKGAPCTGLDVGYGPWDYTNAEHRREKMPIVTNAHFTKDVEMLIKGNRGPLAMDIDYTLRAFPNHHRALYAMMRYQLRTPRPAGAKYAPAECYLQRAMAFQPHDYRVMQLYANYLIKKDQPEMALSVYKKALAVDGVPAHINYSLGLLYMELKKYDLAAEQAKIAYGAGIRKTKLARELKAVNRWPVQ